MKKQTDQHEKCEPPQLPEIAYIENRAMKLLYQQVFQYIQEENLTLFEDNIVTAQVASIFLDFKSTQLGQNKFLVLPVDFLQANANDINKCAKLLKASSMMPYETTEMKDFDNLVLVVGSDNLPQNPPTLFIVRNLRQLQGKSPVIHVWKSSESFKNQRVIQGGLTEREIQVQILLRRILSHRLISGQGASYTIETLPSHTIIVNPTFIDRGLVTVESRKAKSLLQNATNFASKLRGDALEKDTENKAKKNELDSDDEAYIGQSPLITLITGFLKQGLDPMLQEPRGSLSKVKSLQEITIARQDFCETVNEMRDFLYCFYDTDYFEQGDDNQNETLTQSMFMEKASMSPSRQPAIDRYRQDCQQNPQSYQIRNNLHRGGYNSSPSRERSPSHGPPIRRDNIQQYQATQQFQDESSAAIIPIPSNDYNQQMPLSHRQPLVSQPHWTDEFDTNEQEEILQVLKARPHKQEQQISYMQQSPTKEYMEKYHDMDALTAYKHQQIQIYQQNDSSNQGDGNDDDDDGNSNLNNDEDMMEKLVDDQLKQQPVYRQGSFNKSHVKESNDVNGGVNTMLKAFDNFKKKDKLNTNNSVILEDDVPETERSSAQFGDGTLSPSAAAIADKQNTNNNNNKQLQLSGSTAGNILEFIDSGKVNRKRPEMFPQQLSDDDCGSEGQQIKIVKTIDNNNQQKVTETTAENDCTTTTEVEEQKVVSVVPKAKNNNHKAPPAKKTTSKVRKKGDAIIQQIMHNLQKQMQLNDQAQDNAPHNKRVQPSFQPLRTQLRSCSSGASSTDRRKKFHKLQQQADKIMRKKSKKDGTLSSRSHSKPRQNQHQEKTKLQPANNLGSVVGGGKRKKSIDKNAAAIKKLGDQLVSNSNYANAPGSARQKLRFKISPPRESNSDNNGIPQLKNQKDMFKTMQQQPSSSISKQLLQMPLAEQNKIIEVGLEKTGQKEPSRDTYYSKSKQSSKESIEMDGQYMHLQKIGNTMFDVKMDGRNLSRRESAEIFYKTMQKSVTDKHLPVMLVQQQQQKKNPATIKKINKAQKPRANSKMRLQFTLKSDNTNTKSSAKVENLINSAAQADPAQKKRKEIIQELRLSAAKIVIESQEKAKKATKNRQKESSGQQQQFQKLRNGQLSLQQFTTLDQTPITFLATRTIDINDNHAPAVMSPKMLSGLKTTTSYSTSKQGSQKVGQRKSSKKRLNNY